MIRGIFVFIALSLFVLNSQAKLCKTIESKNRIHVNLSENPDYVGFCGMMANRNLLTQFLCEENPEACFLPSFMDIYLSGDARFNGNGDSRIVYQQLIPAENYFDFISQQRKFRAESCMAFSDFFKASVEVSPNANWHERNKTHIYSLIWRQLEKYFDKSCNCYRLPSQPGRTFTAEEVRDYVKNKEGVYDVLNLAYGDFRKEKDHCSQYSVPAFKLKSEKVGPNTEERIVELTRQGRSVKVSLQVKQPGGRLRGSHAVVVTNSRQTCCSGMCTTEFQLLDTLGLYWADRKEDGSWIPAEELFKNLDGTNEIHFLEGSERGRVSLTAEVETQGAIESQL